MSSKSLVLDILIEFVETKTVRSNLNFLNNRKFLLFFFKYSVQKIFGLKLF